MSTFCARCRRPMNREPVIVAGRGYGPVCASKLESGDLLAPAPRAARTTRGMRQARETRQIPLETA